MFATYHVPLKERIEFPTGTYFAIMPRPLLRGTKPIAVVIPEPDPMVEPPGRESPRHIPADESDTGTFTAEQFAKDTEDFDLRKDRIERPFTIASPNLEELCRVEPEKDRWTHRIYGADGTLLARVHRTSGQVFPWPRRVRWHLEVLDTDGTPVHYNAPEGTVRAWTSFVIFSPVWVVLILFGLVSELIGGNDPGFTWDLPARTKWRSGMLKWGLDFHGVGNTYYLNTETMDSRVAYAQAIIQTWTPRGNRKHRSE